MVLRNVPSTATFEEQRVEINELAVDVEALDAAALKAESDTLQTVTGRGFTTTNPLKLKTTQQLLSLSKMDPAMKNLLSIVLTAKLMLVLVQVVLVESIFSITMLVLHLPLL